MTQKSVRRNALRVLGVAVVFFILYSASVTNALVSQFPWLVAALGIVGLVCLVVGLAGFAATSRRFSTRWEQRSTRPPAS